MKVPKINPGKALKIPSKRKRKNTGLAPGSLVFTGEKKLEHIEVTLMEYSAEGLIREATEQGAIPSASEGAVVRWYDIRGLHDVELIRSLGQQFNLHPLVLEDILDTGQRPKFEEYDDSFFLLLQGLSLNAQAVEVETEQVAIYAKEGVVLSFQENGTDLFPGVRARIRSGHGKIKKRGADYLAYALADNIVDHYYLLLDQLETLLDELEVEILRETRRDSKQRIHLLKLQSITLRKVVSPLREAVNEFARCESPLMAEDTDVFVRDLHDHTEQVMENIDSYRDLISGLYDLFVSEVSFKMNSVMQVLTIISTIFIPLTFLAGIYGMNFQHMPELEWRYGYYALWGIMLLIALALIYYFRRRNWL
ncbi:MAG: magnesium/cobalt transporter CorA [Bacteroidetes bacterium]|jgi:magnesium transporter|nr:magnesium/cobalt transporter CorA [Bacteroidota bacterium]